VKVKVKVKVKVEVEVEVEVKVKPPRVMQRRGQRAEGRTHGTRAS
jgi:hypothetical protein